MENIDEFYRWMNQMIKDAKEKLGITEETITFILGEQAALRYYKLMIKRGWNGSNTRDKTQ